MESPLLKFVMDVKGILLLEKKKLVIRAERTMKSVSLVMTASSRLAPNSSLRKMISACVENALIQAMQR